MDIFTQFGIEPVLLLAQIVNFLIILFVLKKFFYKPIVKMLDQRRETIAESLKNAEDIEKKLQETEERSSKVLKDAQEEAQKLIESAQEKSNDTLEQASQEAKKATEVAVAQAMAQISAEKEKMKRELEAETLSLVIMVTQKVLGKKLKTKEKEELTKSAISELSNIK